MSNSQRLEELRWLKNFQAEAVKAGLEFEILKSDGDSPDFLIKYDGRCVGVEITEIHIDEIHNNLSQNDSQNGSRSRKIRSDKDKIIKCAEKKYSNTCSRSIQATFKFNDSYFSENVKRIIRKKMVECIVDVLGKTNLDDKELLKYKKIDGHSTPPTPPFVKSIWVRKTPVAKRRPWKQDNVSYTKKLQPCDLKIVLTKKNQKIENYQKTVCENWLLIYANFDLPYGRFACPENDDSNWPCSKFERTYVFCSEPKQFLIQLDGRGGVRILTSKLESGF